MSTTAKPSGPFRLEEIPLSVRVQAAEQLIRREARRGCAPLDALELKLAALSPSERVYLLTGESVA